MPRAAGVLPPLESRLQWGQWVVSRSRLPLDFDEFMMISSRLLEVPGRAMEGDVHRAVGKRRRDSGDRLFWSEWGEHACDNLLPRGLSGSMALRHS